MEQSFGSEDGASGNSGVSERNRENSEASNLIPFAKSGSGQVAGTAKNKAPEIVAFHRDELYAILQVYSRRVGTDEWRDYAIDMLRERAVFSIFHRTSECPLFTVEKTPKLARKQGAYSVSNASGQILKRGRELKNVLKALDKVPKLVSV